MFGTNSLIAGFSDIKATSLMSEGFLALKAGKKEPPVGVSMKIAAPETTTPDDGGDKTSKSRKSSSSSAKEEEID